MESIFALNTGEREERGVDPEPSNEAGIPAPRVRSIPPSSFSNEEEVTVTQPVPNEGWTEGSDIFNKASCVAPMLVSTLDAAEECSV